MERFDVIVIGMGPGGEAAAGRLLDAGRRVAVVERELIGGECAYWACIPSKTLLRGPEARAAAGRAAGVSTPALDWPGLRDYRDYMIRHLDDTAQVRGYEQAGATVIKGPARLRRAARAEARHHPQVARLALVQLAADRGCADPGSSALNVTCHYPHRNAVCHDEVISTAARGPRGLSPGWRGAASGTRGRQTTDPRDQQPDGYAPLEPPASPARAGQDEEEPDADLLRRHVAGDPDAFGTLFGRHRDRLWAVAIRIMGDPEEAADALQDAMIAAFRRAASFRGDSAVTTWLHRIVVNAALDRMRRRAARPAASGRDQDALDALAAGADPPADPSGSTDTSLDVRAALATLVPDQRAALVLVDMLGYSIAGAAQVLSVSEGTVKSRAARGRARLLPRLAHLRPAGPEQG